MNRIDSLIAMIEGGRKDLIKQMITTHPLDLNQTASWGELPLKVAIMMGDIKMVELLIQNGADPNLIHKERTPLQNAIELDRFDIALYLVQQQINPIRPDTRFNDRSLTPLMMAADRQHRYLILALLEAGADPTLVDQFGCVAADRMPNRILL